MGAATRPTAPGNGCVEPTSSTHSSGAVSSAFSHWTGAAGVVSAPGGALPQPASSTAATRRGPRRKMVGVMGASPGCWAGKPRPYHPRSQALLGNARPRNSVSRPVQGPDAKQSFAEGVPKQSLGTRAGEDGRGRKRQIANLPHATDQAYKVRRRSTGRRGRRPGRPRPAHLELGVEVVVAGRQQLSLHVEDAQGVHARVRLIEQFTDLFQALFQVRQHFRAVHLGPVLGVLQTRQRRLHFLGDLHVGLAEVEEGALLLGLALQDVAVVRVQDRQRQRELNTEVVDARIIVFIRGADDRVAEAVGPLQAQAGVGLGDGRLAGMRRSGRRACAASASASAGPSGSGGTVRSPRRMNLGGPTTPSAERKSLDAVARAVRLWPSRRGRRRSRCAG